MKSTRGDYESGDDFVLEYGDLKFTFNERDFEERCEQASVRLNFVESGLSPEEREDLVNLVVNGDIDTAMSSLGDQGARKLNSAPRPADRRA